MKNIEARAKEFTARNYIINRCDPHSGEIAAATAGYKRGAEDQKTIDLQFTKWVSQWYSWSKELNLFIGRIDKFKEIEVETPEDLYKLYKKEQNG